MRERDSREEDKEEGRGLGEGSFVVWFLGGEIGGRRRGRNSERRRRLVNILVFGNSHRDTVVAGNFGLGGQETARIPGAREPERLFLVGWEVNIQFGAVWAKQGQSEKGLNQLIYRLRYVFCAFY
jgi:hypothetical protein